MYIDDDEMEEKKNQTKKLIRVIIASIIIVLIFIMAIVGLIIYKKDNPTYITTLIDGVEIQNFDGIVDMQKDENGKTELYFQIREFATFLNAANKSFGYKDYSGEYDIKTENANSCYILRAGQEVTVYSKGSKTIYKRNLQTNSNGYEEYTIDKDVFMNNNILYASQDGIEKGYNVLISYNEKMKTFHIYTLDYLIKNQAKKLANKKFGNYGTLIYERDVLNNNKSIFEDVVIVKSSNDRYGILSGDLETFILEPKYDAIDYIPTSKSFSVQSNGKMGLFDKNGMRKIALVYDKIISMGKNSNLYVVKSNNQYGVVDTNKSENDNIIIYPQYDQIGIDISSYAYNGVKNGYFLLDELIPVQQGNLWALYNKNGKQVSDGFKYSSIGCKNIKNGNNYYPLLQIPESKLIVVSDKSYKYGFVDLNGNDSIVSFILDQIYIKTSNGEDSYWMSIITNGEEKERNVLEYLNPNQ